ncbi:MAG: hypothetical protein KDA80_16170, partial [Planctomycetaceae bacterium]|nr:hypothetical protein [Planctomycetaceae bacterium]
APVDLAERVLQSLQTEPSIRNLPIPGTSDFRRLSEGTTNANGSTRQFNWTAVSLTALTLCLLILPAVAPPPGARLVSQAISEKEDLSTRGPLAPDVTQDELEAAKEVYAQWMESASERLNRTASLVLLDEIPNENSTPSHGWFGLWSKEIEKYEEEIGTTLMEFVESTKMDQS